MAADLETMMLRSSMKLRSRDFGDNVLSRHMRHNFENPQ